ncbi:protein-arginine deiminase domain-containing protein [Roseobacter sp. YSTF-M11]|uniref:Protein-arginine deiminase domain-containing protein n=1 Tax=Roseobacter insulae TaxID=2859783 RepID=A0A9X1FTE3_9RHOB|nr:protein-arginine deiminase domain-containing protein [Roseobacter insulae]MBW4707391.1 protein-arginine deiminase domain-containing protein [Roseobacter insulae]
MAPLTVFGDFDQDGRISRKAREQDLKNAFPGLVVLPNIDADGRRLPRKVAPAKPVALDHTRTRSGADNERASLVVAVSDGEARSLQFEVDAGGEEFLRFTDRRHRLLHVTANRFEAPITGVGDYKFSVEAISLRGSPLLGAAARSADPGRFNVTVSALAIDGTMLASDTFTGTVAPWLIIDNMAVPERLYMCQIDEDDPIERGNYPSVQEVSALVKRLRGVTFLPIPHAVNNGDAWIQDQFQLGACHAPRASLRAICHLPRLRSNVSQDGIGANLSTMTPAHFPSADLGLLQDFYLRPVGEATDASGRARTFLFKDSFELSRRLDRLWGLWGLIRSAYFVRDLHKTAQDKKLEEQLLLLNTQGFFDARAAVVRAVGRVRRVLDRRASAAVKDGQKEAMAQLRALLSLRLTLVKKTLILRRDERKIIVPTDAFGDLVFTAREIDDFDENLIGKHGSLNFGGNLEVSPPLKDAPFGKIAFGANAASDTRGADPDLVHFLESQGAQPVVDIETAWLDVAHVDEVMAFVPAPSTKPGSVIAVASPGLAMAIVDAAFGVYMEGGGTMAVAAGNDENALHPALRDKTTDGDAPVTRMLRGRYWLHHLPKDAFATIEPPLIYRDMVRHYPVDFHLQQDDSEVIAYNSEPGRDRNYNASMSIREFRYFGRFTNDWLAENKLTDLHRTLSGAFPDLPRLEIPVLYDEVTWIEDKQTKEIGPDFDNEQTSAFLPNGVNMQILGHHVLVPRPYGPRAAPDVAARILKRAVPSQASLFDAETFRRRGLDRLIHWIKRPIFPGASGSDSARIAAQFADGFADMTEAEVREAIIKANKGAFSSRPNPADELPDLKEGWRRLLIPEGTVDLFEAFIQTRLEALGLKVHFVDTWYYHIRLGEIHCGTNVLRRAPRHAPRWWDAEMRGIG